MLSVRMPAIAKVAPSAMNKRVLDPVSAKIEPAIAKPAAPASIVVAATIALALPS
jgi:hypothetical protein